MKVSSHTHCESFLTASTISNMVEKAKNLSRTHFTYTDQGSLSSALKVYNLCKEKKIKSILGLEFYFLDPTCSIINGTPASRCSYFQGTIYCKNQAAYQALVKTISKTDLATIEIYEENKQLFTWKELEYLATFDTELVIGGSIHDMVGKAFLADSMKTAALIFFKLKHLFENRLSVALLCEKWDRKFSQVIEINYKDGAKDTLLASDSVTTDRARNIKAIDLTIREGHSIIKSKIVGSTFYIVEKEISIVKLHKGYLPLPVDASLEINKLLYNFAKKTDTNVIVTDYAFYCEREDKVVQELILEGKTKLYPTLNMKSEQDFITYLVDIMKLLNEEALKLIENNNQWAAKFDDFELKYETKLAECEGTGIKRMMEIIQENGRMKWDNKEWVSRLKEEVSVIEQNGKMSMTPYFLPIHDVLDFYKKNNRLTGPGRGCLVGDTKVYANDGVKQLKDMSIGDMVIGHSGLTRKVIDIMKYENSEQLLEIKNNFQWGTIKLTKDHKLLGIKRELTDDHSRHLSLKRTWKFEKRKFKKVDIKKCVWDRADSFSKKDLLFTPWPKKRTVIEFRKVDLVVFCKNRKFTYDNDFIYLEIPLENELSSRHIHKITKISRNCLKDIRRGKIFKFTCKKTRKLLSDYLNKFNLTVNEWAVLNNYRTLKINRFFVFDEQSVDIIGRWIGDGWITSKSRSSQWGIAFHRDDVIGKKELTDFFTKKGFEFSIIEHDSKELTQMISYNNILVEFFKYLFPTYIYKSYSKRIGKFIYLNDILLKRLLIGLAKADGHIHINNKNHKGIIVENFDTTSIRMAEELKLCLLYLKIPASVNERKAYIHSSQGYNCRKSYKIRFKGLRTPKSKTLIENEDGYLSEIKEIKKAKSEQVYDITVEDDHSYLTTNYVVHNSAAGSLISYLMGITQVDPFRFDLSFNRFYSIDRINDNKLADIDSDLEDRDLLTGTDKKSGYLYERWGNKAAQISTRTMLRLKNSIKDTNRYIKGKVEPEIELLTKNLPSAPQGVSDDEFIFGFEDQEGDHIDGLIETSQDLLNYSTERPNEWALVQKMLGLSRTHSLHACAFIISNSPISDTIPVKNGHITQYTASEVEKSGLVKYDFLIISQLKDIRVCLDYINKKDNSGLQFDHFLHNGKSTYIWDLPEDSAAFKSIWNGDTESVFQISTQSMIPYVKDILPNSIEDLGIILSLVRPGPLDYVDQNTGRSMAQEYVYRRKGGEYNDIKILKELIPETYSVLVYQEQVTKIAKSLAGFDGSAAEKLREAIGKKKLTTLLAIKPKFIEGCFNSGKITQKEAEELWERIVTFGRYAFNKSHAISYSYITYTCMFLKHYYPLAWWSAVLSNATEQEISQKFWPHVKHLIAPPDINLSTEEMVPDYANNKIRSKLGVIKGMGDKSIAPIVASRPYKDIQDFVNKDVAGPSLSHKLIHVGILDSLFPPNLGLCEKLKLYQDAVEIKKYTDKVEESNKNGTKMRISQPKQGVIPEEYLNLHPFRDVIMKKAVLPSMPIDLHNIAKVHSCRIAPYHTKPIVKNVKGYNTVLLDGEALRKLDELDGNLLKEDVYFAATSYVIDMKEFSYPKKNPTKKALKLILSTDNYLSEKVLWPDYTTSELKYPKELKKGVIASFFYKKRVNKKDVNILEIVVESFTSINKSDNM